jgi:DNA-binding HxlR family transcriptional regulator
MNKEKIKIFAEVETCPVRNVLDRIGDKWSMLILLVLNGEGVLRFNEIHKFIATISQKMLSTTLKSLEADGLVHRKVFPEIPPRVEYGLTERGRSIIPHLNGLMEWANENMEAIQSSRKAYPQ